MRPTLQATAIIIALSTSLTPAAAAMPTQPVGPWRVNYGDSQCVAMRDYGSGPDRQTLVLKPSPTGDVMRILVFRNGRDDVQQAAAQLSFGNQVVDASLLSYPDPKNHFQIAEMNVPMSSFRAEAAAPSLDINGGPIDASFALDGVPQVAAELDKCLADLQDFWNVGPRYRARVASGSLPETGLRGLFTGGGDKWESLFKKEQGTVTMTLLVNEKGAVDDCSVDDSSGGLVLDTMSCYVVTNRARFRPATGPNGAPVRSAYTARLVLP